MIHNLYIFSEYQFLHIRNAFEGMAIFKITQMKQFNPATEGTSQCNSVPVPSPEKWGGLGLGRASTHKTPCQNLM